MTGKDGTNTLEAPPPGGGGINTLEASPGGGDGTNTLEASPGGGGIGTNTLVQPNYPTPTQSVNPAGARGRGARKGQQSRGTRWRGWQRDITRVNCAASTGTACGSTPIPHVQHKMPPKRPFSLLGTQRQRATRVEDLEAGLAASLCEEYRAQLQPDGSILLVPEDYSRPTDTNPNHKSEALRVLW